MRFIKHSTILSSFLLSFNVVAIDGNLLSCDSNDTLEKYNNLHQMMEKNSNTDPKSALLYDLVKVSLCLGEDKKAEGLELLQKASDAEYVMANSLLGMYYIHDQTFDFLKKTRNLENLNQAIHYYEKGVQIIESLPNYPKGAKDDMEYIESIDYTSYFLFTYLPVFYFQKYLIIMHNITHEAKENAPKDTFDIIDKINKTSTQCLARPVLAIWKKKKKKIIERSQEIICSALLKFAEEVYLLEQYRTKINEVYKAPENDRIKLKQTRRMINNILKLTKDAVYQLNLAPKIY